MAKRKEVLLVKDVLKLGNMGDVVRVSAGYARNYLFPYGMAIPMGESHKRQIEVLREKAAKSEVEREGKAKVLSKSMQGLVIQVGARVAHDDELFGSIGIKEIVAALAKAGVEIDSKQVHLHDKLRKLGRYDIDIRLHKNVALTVKLEIVNSDPNAPSLDETLAAIAAAREAAKAAKKAPPAEGEAVADGEKPATADAEAKPEGKVEAKAKPEPKAKSEPKAKPEGKAEGKPAKGEKSEKGEGKSAGAKKQKA